MAPTREQELKTTETAKGNENCTEMQKRKSHAHNKLFRKFREISYSLKLRKNAPHSVRPREIHQHVRILFYCKYARIGGENI